MSSIPNVRIRTRPVPQQDKTSSASAEQNDPITAKTNPRGAPIPPRDYDPEAPFNLGGVPIERGSEQLSGDIAVRSRQVARMSNEYAEEFILQNLHQLILARVPKDQIAQRFGVTTRTIMNWQKKLYAKLKEEAKDMDPTSFLGESMEFYKQIRAAGMAMYLTGKTTREKQIGLDQARNSHNDMQKFLHLAGFFDVVKFQPRPDTDDNDPSRLGEEVARGARDVLSAFEVLDGEVIHDDADIDLDGDIGEVDLGAAIEDALEVGED